MFRRLTVAVRYNDGERQLHPEEGGVFLPQQLFGIKRAAAGICFPGSSGYKNLNLHLSLPAVSSSRDGGLLEHQSPKLCCIKPLLLQFSTSVRRDGS